MLNENIKSRRRAKGWSQQDLADRLHVVRQTVSKWEMGISLPDAEMLIKLAEVLEVPTSTLLGETLPTEETQREDTLQALSAKLELLNLRIAERDEKSRRLRRIALWLVIAVAALILLSQLATTVFSLIAFNKADASVGIIGGADGPTAILVASRDADFPTLLFAAVALILSIIGIKKTK